MRIILKPPYKGYSPALDPFSKEKIVWIKNKVNKFGIVPVATYITFFAPILIFSFWAANLRDSQNDINIYRDLGHDKFILIFTIAIIVGIVGYLCLLFIHAFKKTQKITPTESLKRYKEEVPVRLKEQQEQMKNLWKGVLFLIVVYGCFFWILFQDSKNFGLTGASLGVAIFLVIFATVSILYFSTTYFARKYVNHKFNIKPNDKRSVPKKNSK